MPTPFTGSPTGVVGRLLLDSPEGIFRQGLGQKNLPVELQPIRRKLYHTDADTLVRRDIVVLVLGREVA